MDRNFENEFDTDSGYPNSSGKDAIQEMEQIQRGLEAFLEQELKNMQEKEPEVTDFSEKKDDKGNTENEFLNTEWMAEKTDKGGQQDMSRGHKTSQENQEDYFEDWDSPKPSKRVETENGKEQFVSAKRSKGNKNKVKEKISEENTMNTSKKKTKKRRKKSKWLRFLFFVLILIAILAIGLYFLVGNVYHKMNYVPIENVTQEPMQEEEVINILLIGSDARGEEKGRSDAMILISISNKTKKIYMTSLLRDMYVEIPGYKNNRLNAAYSFGGAELLMETMEQNFDIQVNRYVLVNFEAFANLVDAVGGIDLELTREELEYVNGYLVEYNMLYGRPEGTDYMDTSLGGMVHLNGPQALAYTRNRYLGTDFGRTERQRKVLDAIIKKAPSALLTNSEELIGGLMPNLTTNLTQKECYQLSLMAGKVLTYDIVQSSIPQEGTYRNVNIRGMSVLEVDFEANKKFLQDTIYGEGEVLEEQQ